MPFRYENIGVGVHRKRTQAAHYRRHQTTSPAQYLPPACDLLPHRWLTNADATTCVSVGSKVSQANDVARGSVTVTLVRRELGADVIGMKAADIHKLPLEEEQFGVARAGCVRFCSVKLLNRGWWVVHTTKKHR